MGHQKYYYADGSLENSDGNYFWEINGFVLIFLSKWGKPQNLAISLWTINCLGIRYYNQDGKILKEELLSITEMHI